jgi:hypothetical protein
MLSSNDITDGARNRDLAILNNSRVRSTDWYLFYVVGNNDASWG